MTQRPLLQTLSLVLCVVLGWHPQAQAGELNEIVAEADRAMGRVIVSDVADVSSGSGFVIGRDSSGHPVFLTNYHVVNAGTDVLVVFRDGESELVLFKGEVIAASPGRDMAALVLFPQEANDFVPAVLALSVRELDKGETVASLGYPATSDVVLANPGNIAFFETTLTQGLVSKVFVSPWQNTGATEEIEIVQHTAAINHGNSGGPLLDECGQTVGMNTAGLLEGGGVFLASSARSIADFLDGAGIAYSSNDTRCGQITEPGFITESATSGEEPVAAADKAMTEPLVPGVMREAIWQNVLLAVSIASGLGLIVALVVVLNRRSSAAQPPVSPPALVLAVRAGSGLRQSVPLSSNQLSRGIILGRGADVDVDVAGISRQHARIWIENRKLMVADLGSRNGTTVDGEPLQQGQAHQVNSRSTILLAGVVTLELGTA